MPLGTEQELDLRALGAALPGVVRRALAIESLELGSWKSARIHGGVGAASGGVYRFTGTAQVGVSTRSWSLILKALNAPTSGTSFTAMPVAGWDREVKTYESGLLAKLPAGLAAPECFAIDKQSGVVWLWLEDINEEVGPHWPVAQFAQAARHLGRLNGSFLASGALPTHPWLERNLLRWRAEASRLLG